MDAPHYTDVVSEQISTNANFGNAETVIPVMESSSNRPLYRQRWSS